MTNKPKLRSRFRRLLSRLRANLRQLPPLLVVRLLLSAIPDLPSLVYSLFSSWQKMQQWKNVKVCQEFMRRHRLAFEGVDESTLTVELLSGGVSNVNQVWRCRRFSGEEVSYFVKIFVLAGSFWAKHLSLVSPFPQIRGGKEHERFTVDVVSRVQLAECGIPVPRAIAYDAVEKVMVTEYLKGEVVDEILQQIAAKKQVDTEGREAIRQCGLNLAKIHRAGFSLIDTQPANCLWVASEQKIYFTDFEFCTREDKRIWDVGFFLCFLVLRMTGSVKNEVRQIFIESYQQECPLNLTDVEKISQQLKEYFPIMQTILDIRQFTPEELLEELLGSKTNFLAEVPPIQMSSN